MTGGMLYVTNCDTPRECARLYVTRETGVRYAAYTARFGFLVPSVCASTTNFNAVERLVVGETELKPAAATAAAASRYARRAIPAAAPPPPCTTAGMVRCL